MKVHNYRIQQAIAPVALAVALTGSIGAGIASAQVEVGIICDVYSSTVNNAGTIQGPGYGNTYAEAEQAAINWAAEKATHILPGGQVRNCRPL